jgi:hypothetical protein
MMSALRIKILPALLTLTQLEADIFLFSVSEQNVSEFLNPYQLHHKTDLEVLLNYKLRHCQNQINNTKLNLIKYF